MAVGSGEWRGRALEYPDDITLRPTMQRTKHSLFSSLGRRLRGAVFADCFAGAGGVGYIVAQSKKRHPIFQETIAILRGDEKALQQNLQAGDD